MLSNRFYKKKWNFMGIFYSDETTKLDAGAKMNNIRCIAY